MPNACGSCHLMSGQGHPESADLAGMPPEYIIRQMTYFKSGARSKETRMGPSARASSEEEVRGGAAYFAAITPAPFVKVIEAATPPKTYASADARHRRIHPDGGTEPIGRRIIQIPEDPMRTTIRDPHSGFIAYVPPGSIARGAALAKAGDAGRTIQCALCHGDALTGLGEVPRIAGLQPVYIARQLLMMQNGTSAGANAALMKKVVVNLSEDDIIALSAYLGSLPPRPPIHSEFVFETAPFASAHASTIVETRDGLVTAWFGGTREGASDVGIWLSRHVTGEWTRPIEVATGIQPDGGRYPCWNPVLFDVPGRALMLFYKVGPSPQSWWGMVRTSHDSGRTWSGARRLPVGILGPVKNKPVHLSDGTLVAGSS